MSSYTVGNSVLLLALGTILSGWKEIQQGCGYLSFDLFCFVLLRYIFILAA